MAAPTPKPIWPLPFRDIRRDDEDFDWKMRRLLEHIERHGPHGGGEVGVAPGFVDSPGYVIADKDSDSFQIWQRIAGSPTLLYSVTGLAPGTSQGPHTSWAPGQIRAFACQRNDPGVTPPRLYLINTADPNPANWTHTIRDLTELDSAAATIMCCTHCSPLTGHYLAVAKSQSSGQTLLVFDTTTMAVVAFAPPFMNNGIRQVRFSPSENMLVISHGTEVSVYSVPQWTRIFHLTGLPSSGGKVAFSHDNARLAVSRNGLVEFFNTANWTVVATIEVLHSGNARHADVGYSMDGEWFGAINFTSTTSNRLRLYALPDLTTPTMDFSSSIVATGGSPIVDFLPVPNVEELIFTRGGNPGSGVRGVIGQPLFGGTMVQHTSGNFFSNGRSSPL